MGSFNIHCCLTGKNLPSSTPFYGIYLQQTKVGIEDSLGKNIFVSREGARALFHPISIPYLMTHDGYGRFDLVNPNDPLFLEFKNNRNLTDEELLGDRNPPTIPCAVFSKEALECAVRLSENDSYFVEYVKREFEKVSTQFIRPFFSFDFPLLEQHKERYANDKGSMFSYFFQTEAIAYVLAKVGRFYHAALYCSESADTTLFIKALAEAVPEDFPKCEEEGEGEG